jgi:transcriptional regulator with XRE-family HTH domain
MRHRRLPNPIGAKLPSHVHEIHKMAAGPHRLDYGPFLAHRAPMSVALKMKRSLATAIRERMAAENLNITTFARKTKTGRNSIRRILNSNNTSITLNSIGKAAEALDLDFTLSAKVLTPEQLGELADRLDSADILEKASLGEEFVAGFHGKPVRRAIAKNKKV